MNKQKDTMTPERWARIKALSPSASRLAFKSCDAYMQPIYGADGITIIGSKPFIARGTSAITPETALKRGTRRGEAVYGEQS